MYLSYDNEAGGQDVYIDEFKITYQESPVTQINSYYPFGMTAFSWVRGGEDENKYLYQGKEYQSPTGLHDFHARQYDAVLGRWFAIDPAGQFSSPYLAMANDPFGGIDPNGKTWLSKFGKWAHSVHLLKKILVAVVAVAVLTDGAGEAFLEPLLSGAVSEGAASVLTGVATGAVTGGASGLIQAAAFGGNLHQALYRGLISGAVGGGFGSGIKAIKGFKPGLLKTWLREQLPDLLEVL